MRTATILLSAALCLASCKTVRYLPAEKIVETRTEVMEVIRDTTVYVPADQATVRALLECDSAGQVLVRQVETLQGKINAKANIRIKDNIVIAECECDSLNIYLQLKDRYQTTTSSTVETKIQQVEKELKWWQKALMWMGAIGLFSVIAVTGIRIYKGIL